MNVRRGKGKIILSMVFADPMLGIREMEDHIWLASFVEYDLGYFDCERGRGIRPPPRRAVPPFHPFMPDKVLTMCPERFELPTIWFELGLLNFYLLF